LLQDLLRIGPAEATRRVAHAAAINGPATVSGPPLPPPLPATAKAVRAGSINAEHVETIRRVIGELSPEVAVVEREAAEHTLVEAAHTLGPVAIGKLGRAIQARVDQDGRRPSEAEPGRPGNELRWHSHHNGTLEFRGRLAAEGAALWTTALGPLAKPQPATAAGPDPRTRAERHGDALVDALRRLVTAGDLPTEGGERPNVLVTVSLDSLREQSEPALLGDRTRIDAGTARRLACDSAIIPAVLGSPSEPLDIGRKTRTVPTAIRRALVLRDRGCAFPGCPIPATWCDAHHHRHWANGGPTSLPNLVLLCSTHHSLIHHSDWQVNLASGVPEFIPPRYLDPHQQPAATPSTPHWPRSHCPHPPDPYRRWERGPSGLGSRPGNHARCREV